MAKPWSQYTKEMWKNFGYLATWTPGGAVALGDVGILRDNVFSRITTLAALGIAYAERADTTTEDISYSSSGSVAITFKAAGTAPAVGSVLTQTEAGATIDFTRQKAVLFEANACTTPSIEDTLVVGSEITRRYETGQWHREWVVVTEIVVAESGTVLISENKGSRIEISAGTNVSAAAFRLADARLGLTIVSQRDMQTALVSRAGLTPLFRARGLRSKIPINLHMASKGRDHLDLLSPAEGVRQGFVTFDEVPLDWSGLETEPS